MTATRRSDAFSIWLEARVAGAALPDHTFDADPDLDSLVSAASRFHDMSDAWAQDVEVHALPVTPWEDLMTQNPVSPSAALPIPARRHLAGRSSGARDIVNRFATVCLVLVTVLALGGGAWRLADRGMFGGNTAPPTNTVAGLAPDGDVATPAGTRQPDATPTVATTTPIEQLPGIEGAVLRDYLPVDEPSAIADLSGIAVLVFRFDSAANARTSFDLIVSTFAADFETTVSNNTGFSMTTNDLPGVGDRAATVRLDYPAEEGYQAQEYVLTLDGTRVFGVMTVTGGPYAGEGTPASVDGASAAAIDLATALVASGQPSPEDARFYADGTSTGGDWGFMPVAGDPLLAGLLPQNDQLLYPVESSGGATAATFPPDASDLAGIVAAVYREYAPDDMFVGSQSSSIADATPMTEAELASNRFSSIAISVYQFATPKDAAVAYDRLGNGLLGSLTGFYQGDGQERLLSEDISGIGDQATWAHLTVTSTGGGWTSQTVFQYITVQRGEYVFVVSAQSQLGPVETLPDAAGQPDPMLDLATQLATGDEPLAEDPVFNPDGTSTGGLWGFMPAASDPLLMGLVPWMDSVQYPLPG